jgi:hypothetical protein
LLFFFREIVKDGDGLEGWAGTSVEYLVQSMRLTRRATLVSLADLPFVVRSATRTFSLGIRHNSPAEVESWP